MKIKNNRFGAAEIASDIAARHVSGSWSELLESFGEAILPWDALQEPSEGESANGRRFEPLGGATPLPCPVCQDQAR